MSRTLKGLSVGMLLFAPVLAQAAPGESLEAKGRLAATDPLDPVRKHACKIHEVKIFKSKSYQIDLMSDDFDSYLRLVNAAGVQVAEDDDGGDKNNARINYTPVADETFKIYVTSYGGGAGNYLLQIQGPGAEFVKSAGLAAAEPVLNVEDNIQPTDNIDPVQKKPGKVHEVKLKKGTTYQLDLMSKDFDTFLRLEDETGREVASDDDGGEGLNSRVTYKADKDAAFKIFATSFDGGEGNYTLIVLPLAATPAVAGAMDLPAPTADKAAQQTGQLQLNDPADPVRQRPAKLYTVELKAGKTYVIDLMSAQFDCFLRLENPDGKQLAQDDDGGDGLNSRIRFQCMADGRYRLYAAALFMGQGQFNLVVTEQP